MRLFKRRKPPRHHVFRGLAPFDIHAAYGSSVTVTDGGPGFTLLLHADGVVEFRYPALTSEQLGDWSVCNALEETEISDILRFHNRYWDICR